MSPDKPIPELLTPEQADITRVRRQDAAEVAAFWQPIFADTYPNGQQVTREMFEGHSFRSQLATHLEKDLANPAMSLQAARRGGATLGTIGLGIEPFVPGDGYVWGFYVATGLQGRGFGKLLWSQAMANAERMRIRSLSLLVAENSIKAIAFYKRNGFIKTGSVVQPWPSWLDKPVDNEIWTMSRAA